MIFASSASSATVSFAITSTFASPPSSFRSTTTCSTGTAPATFSIRSTTCLRIQPERDSGCVETMISSTGGSSCASASRTESTGSVSTTKPSAEIPAARSCSERLVEPAPGGRAPGVLVDDVALAGAFTGQTTVTWSAPRRFTASVSARPATVSFATTSR